MLNIYSFKEKHNSLPLYSTRQMLCKKLLSILSIKNYQGREVVSSRPHFTHGETHARTWGKRDPYPHSEPCSPVFCAPSHHPNFATQNCVFKKKQRVFVYVFAGDFMVFIWQTNRWMKIKSAMENYQLEVEYFKILVFL